MKRLRVAAEEAAGFLSRALAVASSARTTACAAAESAATSVSLPSILPKALTHPRALLPAPSAATRERCVPSRRVVWKLTAAAAVRR